MTAGHQYTGPLLLCVANRDRARKVCQLQRAGGIDGADASRGVAHVRQHGIEALQQLAAALNGSLWLQQACGLRGLRGNLSPATQHVWRSMSGGAHGCCRLFGLDGGPQTGPNLRRVLSQHRLAEAIHVSLQRAHAVVAVLCWH